MASGTGDLNYKRAHVFYAFADLLSARFRAVYKLQQIREGGEHTRDITYWFRKVATWRILLCDLLFTRLSITLQFLFNSSTDLLLNETKNVKSFSQIHKMTKTASLYEQLF